MRIILFTFASLAVACGSVQSTDQCCVDEADCAQIKSEVVIPCEAGQVCTAQHECVVAQCETSMDCTDDAPICRLGFCESTCSSDMDCADVARRTKCSPEGACVGCVDAMDCSGNTSVCDAEENVCRGCERDTECASGVCIEAEGTCAVEADILYVSNGTDAGDCTKTSPCASIGYALSKIRFDSVRNVIRLEGGFAGASASLNISVRVVIDGTGTMVMKPATAVPLFNVTGGELVLGGVTIQGNQTMNDPTIVVSNATLHAGPGTVLKGILRSTNGTANLDRMRVESTVYCMNGTLDIHRTTLEGATGAFNGQVWSTNCQLTIKQSSFTNSSDDMLEVSGGKVVVENTVFANTYEYSDSIRVASAAPGSVFRFNTVVNLSGIDSDGVALACDSSLKVTSNIFAYRSMHPLGYGAGCQTEFSVFDDVTGTLPTPATDSSFVPFSSLFVDAPGRDFKLAASSGAKGAADPSIPDVLVDISGNPRPNPAGAAADAGAHEAP